MPRGGVAKPRCRTLRVFPIALNILPQDVLQLENSFHRKLETLNRKIIYKGNTGNAGNARNTAPSRRRPSALRPGWPAQPPPVNLLHITRGHSRQNAPRLPQAAILQGCFGTAPQPSILPPCNHLGSLNFKDSVERTLHVRYVRARRVLCEMTRSAALPPIRTPQARSKQTRGTIGGWWHL